MSEDIVISVKNLIKTYKLYDSHADRVKETFHPFRKKYHHPFNALDDVSFDVKKGETLGIIGRNGSGKSTLLQIICGILQPSSGSVESNGRISALLELGAGFNPEFTGRQNIYMNCAILGLTNEEIKARFDDIVAFAEIGDFIGQPVKSYSSGMYVRLAFAVAINVDPDILIVDEALAVGDEGFQRKCFARIRQIQERGGTILFVSHGAATIIELCTRAMLFDQGELILNGSPKKVVSYYHKMIFAPPDKLDSLREEIKENFGGTAVNGTSQGDDVNQSIETIQIEEQAYYDPELKPRSTVSYESCGAQIHDPHIITSQEKRVNVLVSGSEYVYTYTVVFMEAAFSVGFGMLIKTVTGFELGGATTTTGNVLDYVEAGSEIRVKFKFKCMIVPGVYFLNAGVSGIMNEERKYFHRLVDAEMFRVQAGDSKMVTGIVDFSAQPEVLRFK